MKYFNVGRQILTQTLLDPREHIFSFYKSFFFLRRREYRISISRTESSSLSINGWNLDTLSLAQGVKCTSGRASEMSAWERRIRNVWMQRMHGRQSARAARADVRSHRSLRAEGDPFVAFGCCLNNAFRRAPRLRAPPPPLPPPRCTNELKGLWVNCSRFDPLELSTITRLSQTARKSVVIHSGRVVPVADLVRSSLVSWNRASSHTPSVCACICVYVCKKRSDFILRTIDGCGCSV